MASYTTEEGTSRPETRLVCQDPRRIQERSSSHSPTTESDRTLGPNGHSEGYTASAAAAPEVKNTPYESATWDATGEYGVVSPGYRLHSGPIYNTYAVVRGYNLSTICVSNKGTLHSTFETF